MRMTDTSFYIALVALVFPWAIVATDAQADACASASNPFEQVSCYWAAARAENDLAACDRARHEGVRYQCYALYAEHTASADICRRIPATSEEHRSLVDTCLSDVALKARDPALCEGVTATGLRDSCYLKLARALDDRALCAAIHDPGLKSLCDGQPVMVQ